MVTDITPGRRRAAVRALGRTRLGRLAGVALVSVGLVAAGTVVAPTPASAAITGDLQFSGHGWGHGRGLGQWGSYGYAINAGWDSGRILAHYYGGTTQSQQANTPITVALTAQDGKELVVTSGRDFVVGGVRVGAGSAARVIARPDGTFQLSTSYGCASPVVWTTTIPDGQVRPTVEPGNDLTAMLTLCTATGTKQYRGELWAVYARSTQRTINNVRMEDYLRGVVPRESPASWGDGGGGKGIEALEAQSVAARSYAWAENRGTDAKTCDTTSCQVYLGAGTNMAPLEDRRTDTAIAATAGIVLRNSSGAIVRAEFSSSTGGYSAGGTFPAVPDAGDDISPHHNWSQTVPAATIANAYGVGELMSVRVTARNGLGADGGRVTSVEVVGSAKTVTVSGANMRTALGLKSDWFTVAAGATPAPPGGPAPTTPPAAPTSSAPPSLPAFFQATGDGGGATVAAVSYGDRGDVPLACDWNGDGVDTTAVFRSGTFHVASATSGRADTSFAFGQAGDQPVCGDWDGDGKESVGLYRAGTVFLRNSLTSGIADSRFFFGSPGDVLVAGDWNGDRVATVGVWRSGTFFLTQSNAQPVASTVFAYGGGSDLPLVADWDGDGKDSVGIHRGNSFYLRNSTTSGVAERIVVFGDSSDAPVAGSWSAGAKDTIGITRGY